MKAMKWMVGMTLSAVAGGAFALIGFFYLYPAPDTATSASSVQTRFLSQEPGSRLVSEPRVAEAFASVDMSNAAEATVHGVVHVTTRIEGQSYYQINPLHYFFYGEAEAVPKKGPDQMSSGSGVIVSKDGYIVTNNHVVQGAKEVSVTLNNNRDYSAQVIGMDPSTDLALLKIEGDDFDAIPLGNSDEVRLGEWVLAVGNPFNLNSTVTAGIVSAKGRNINILRGGRENGVTPIESFIQTDAAVNPGNSGGALVNTQGELIGINTAIKSPTGSFAGYSFAVPVNIVRKVVDDLREYGAVQRGYIGVSIRDVDQELAKSLELVEPRGIYVNGLMEEGAAEQAGLEEGDIIVSVGAVDVNTVPELQEQVSKYRPGDEVLVGILRDNKTVEIPVTLRNRFGNTKLMPKEAKEKTLWVLGASFEEVTEQELDKLPISNGVKVEKLNKGKLREAGVRQGFIITRVDKKPVKDVAELKRALSEKEGGVLIEGIYPNGLRGYYGVGM